MFTEYLKDNMSEIERKQRLLDKLHRKEYITDSDVGISNNKQIGISNNKQKSRLDDVPLNTPVFLIDANHNLYTGTIVSTDRGLQRGECFYGDSDAFYRSAIVDWAYL